MGVEGCRWGVALGPRVRVEPCAGWHGGRYTAHIIEGPSRQRWLALAELTARLGFELDSWRGRVILGGFMPIGQLSIRRQGRSFYEIGAGAVLGIELAIAPLTL